MEKISNLTINLLEQTLLRMYYQYAPSWEKFLENDKQPAILKTEKELRDMECGKRQIAVSKKVCQCVKSKVLNTYIKCHPPVFGYNDSFDFEFDLSHYYSDEIENTPPYSANLKTDITVTIIKKLFKKIEKKTETKYIEFTFPEVLVSLNETLNKYIKYIASCGLLEYDRLPISYDVSLGTNDNRHKNEIVDLEDLESSEQGYKLDIEEDETYELKLVTEYDEFIVDANSDGQCKITSKHQPAKLYLTHTFFAQYLPKEDIIGQILKKYFNLNVITGDEIDESLDTHPSRSEFNAWLEERVKTVVGQSRPIDTANIDELDDEDDEEE